MASPSFQRHPEEVEPAPAAPPGRRRGRALDATPPPRDSLRLIASRRAFRRPSPALSTQRGRPAIRLVARASPRFAGAFRRPSPAVSGGTWRRLSRHLGSVPWNGALAVRPAAAAADSENLGLTGCRGHARRTHAHARTRARARTHAHTHQRTHRHIHTNCVCGAGGRKRFRRWQ